MKDIPHFFYSGICLGMFDPIGKDEQGVLIRPPAGRQGCQGGFRLFGAVIDKKAYGCGVHSFERISVFKFRGRIIRKI